MNDYFKPRINWKNKQYVRGYKTGYMRAKRYYDHMPRPEATELAKKVMANEIGRDKKHPTLMSRARKIRPQLEGNAAWRALEARV